jgi:hypothetical protein
MRYQLDATIGDLLIFNIINISSTCFRCLYTHHQESRSSCVLLPVVLCSDCSCVGSGELGGKMCSLLRGCCLKATSHHPTRRNQHSYNQNITPQTAIRSPICSPDDGRKCARKILRKYWISLNHQLLQLVGLAFVYSLCLLCPSVGLPSSLALEQHIAI